MTTAQKLIAYRKELINGGFSPELAEHLVRDAAHQQIIQSGLVVAVEPKPAE